MHNHIHLLTTPKDEYSLPRTMQSVGRRYVQYFNRSCRCSGSLWEGRYKLGLVDTDRYLLACYRHIELNSVRTDIARRPVDYPYSSFYANALGKSDSLVTPHRIYLDLIAGGVGVESAHNMHHLETRQVNSSRKSLRYRFDSDPGDTTPYLALFEQTVSRKELTEIRRGTEKGIGIGQADFLLKVAKLAGGIDPH
ncbi:MAG: transposase [Candidatus Thiodiazotropha sp.]